VPYTVQTLGRTEDGVGARMRRRAIVATWAVSVLAAALPTSAAAAGTLYHYRIVSRGVAANWTTCPRTTVGELCTFTSIQADHASVFVKDPDQITGTVNERADCVYFAQTLARTSSSGVRTDLVHVSAYNCGGASVNVPASLGRGEVEGELPAQTCDLTTTPWTCRDTTLQFSLAWAPSGDLRRTPNSVERITYPYAKCLNHYIPDGVAPATVAGEVTALAGPLGEFDGQATYIFDGGEIQLGTSHDCLD
jgi:hypothetical protein